MSHSIHLSSETLLCAVRQILQMKGLSDRNAAIVAETLIYADLRGVSSHGVARLASYLERIDAGVMVADPAMRIVNDRPGAALLDAENGFGQVAARRAMQLAMDKADSQGVGVVGVSNSNHFGVAAFFVQQAAEQGQIGMVLTNASPAMAPYNTSTPLLGTNPIAFGIPVRDSRPIVLDMSTTLVARGKIRLAAGLGQPILEGWAVDERGNPTTDAQAALRGSLAPVGGAKGAGLSLVIDILTGVLMGQVMTGDVRNITDTSGPSRTSHMMVAIDIATFLPPEVFSSSVAEVVKNIKQMPPVDGSAVYLPGEVEYLAQERRRVEGIELPGKVAETLEGLAVSCGFSILENKV